MRKNRSPCRRRGLCLEERPDGRSRGGVKGVRQVVPACERKSKDGGGIQAKLGSRRTVVAGKSAAAARDSSSGATDQSVQGDPLPPVDQHLDRSTGRQRLPWLRIVKRHSTASMVRSIWLRRSVAGGGVDVDLHEGRCL